jgi:hypothetical protein
MLLPDQLFLCYRSPFVSLVGSSVQLLKSGLESLVERSVLGYPRLADLIIDTLFKQVNFGIFIFVL